MARRLRYPRQTSLDRTLSVLRRDMKRYPNTADAAMGLVLVVAAVACITIIVATAAYQIFGRITYPDSTQPILWSAYLPFLAMLCGVIVTRHLLLRTRVPTWTYVLLLAVTGLAIPYSLIWFSNPMHDIALLFGSHGRWGCSTINEDGSPHYLIRDDTVALMLFAPVALATIAHWVWPRRRRRTEPSLAAENAAAEG